ncbi:MAG: hypothetical protein K2K53_12955, partial [Oscillospiraceae bacterium]|nr:hypothetical protein [Oscillospiraceae bacterium]
MTVTPITLVSISANDLHRSYRLNDALVSGATAVETVSDLVLPDEARLVTDIPAGGATLTMPIPGWSHGQSNGNWPSPTTDGSGNPISGTGTDMGDLKKDTGSTTPPPADVEYLHWPTENDIGKWNDDDGNGMKVGANRAGLYTFFMATNYGGSQTHFTRPEIKAAYPWLTVPDNTQVPNDVEAWPLEDATRRIVWEGELNPEEPQK